MPPQIATVLFAVGIAGLFWLDRDGSLRPSKALWLPRIWVCIAAHGLCLPGSGWSAGGNPWSASPGQRDRPDVAGVLMLLGAIVLIRRRRKVRDLLKASWPIVLYFSFCLGQPSLVRFSRVGLQAMGQGSGRIGHGADCGYGRSADCSLEAPFLANRVCPLARFCPFDQVLPGAWPRIWS